NLAVDSELFVAALVQVLNCPRRVHAAGAVGLRRLVGIMHSLRTPSDGSDDNRSPASRRQQLAGLPPLPAERLQPLGIPLPDSMPDNRRDVIRNVHGVTGTCCGSGSGD